MEEKENLIKKLSRIWADFKHAVGKSKIVKGLATTALAAGLAISAAGCTLTINVPDPPIDQTQTDDPNKDLNDDQSGNQQNQGTQPGGSTTPTQPDYSQYSQLLQDILKSDYYNGLIAKTKAGELNVTGTAGRGYNILKGIPYKFLDNAGENIDSIKNNEITVTGYSYVIKNENDTYNNELYLGTTIFNSLNNKDYYKIYLNKYTLDNDELSDYFRLTSGNYYQANFFLQELDNQKQAQPISEFSIDKNTYSELLHGFNISEKIISSFSAESIDGFDIINFVPDEDDPESYFMSVNCIFKTEDDINEKYRHIGNMTIRIHSYGIISFNNNIFKMEDPTAFKSKNISSDIKKIVTYNQKANKDLVIK